jgi:hypothetical protein
MPSPSDLYPLISNTEVDLRKELDNMFHGTALEIPKARQVMLRRMRTDSEGVLVPAPSVDPLTKEPDLDIIDPYSLGESYLWDEELVDCRKMFHGSDSSFASRIKFMSPGQLNVQSILFFFQYDVEPKLRDRIIEIQLDLDGDIVVPITRTKVYRPQTIIDYRSDFGRLEYWAVYCTEKDAINI